VLYVGISDTPAWIVSRAQTLAELRGWSPFVALQIEYSLVERTPERELLPMAEALNLTVTPWSPLAGGVLTGKYATGMGGEGRFTDAGMKQFQSAGERIDGIVKEVLAIAQQCGRSPAQVALAWLRHRSRPTIPIIGARKLEQLKDNIACLTLKLDASQVERLDRASAIKMGFPHDFFRKDMVRALVYAGHRDRIDAALP
jgi:aryl-alcohol dehydrogenase-like predicted oxidoreductase